MIELERGRAVAADGCGLAYQVAGEGPPVLLLPGQANNHTWWDRVRPDLARHARTITFDYRGLGDSDDAEDGYSMRQFAADAVAVLDALGIEECGVYGASMGGRVAQRIALDHPGRIRRLVLGCTSPGGPHARERDVSVRRLLVGPGAREALEDLFYSPAWRAEHPGPYATLGDPGASRRAKAGHLRASDQHDAWDELPRITAPTLILHGTDDRLAPVENASLLAGRVPGARVEILAGARHGYFDECAPDVTRLALDHLLG